MGNTLKRALRRCETETRDWTALPDELVGSIAERLPLPDHARLRGVCASWAPAAAEIGIYPPSTSHFPWLMLNADGGTGCFLSLTDSRSYCHLPGTVTEKSTCVGSSRDGWLVILDSTNMFLRNPITSAQINLPSFDTLPWSKTFFDVRKVAVSSSGTVIAVAVFYSLSCCHLAYARLGDDEWTPLDFLSPPNQRIEDIVYHDHKFFIVFTKGRVQSFDLTANASRLYGNCNSLQNISYSLYLVSSSDNNLLLVRREKEKLSGNTTGFRVAKFDSGSDSGWVEIKDLGDQCLFLDNKSSFSVSTKTTTEVRRNCIYFADEVPHSGKVNAGDLRVFDMEKGIICSLQLAGSKIQCRLLMSPVWFMPSV